MRPPFPGANDFGRCAEGACGHLRRECSSVDTGDRPTGHYSRGNQPEQLLVLDLAAADLPFADCGR
jgi:hypothetical protein